MNDRFSSMKLAFLISSLSDGCCISNDGILNRMSRYDAAIKSDIRQIPLSDLVEWNCTDERIVHLINHNTISK